MITRRGWLVVAALVLALGPAGPPDHAVAQDVAGLAVVDTVSIRLEMGRASIEVRIPSALGVVEAYAIRLPGQTIDVTEVSSARGPLESTLIREAGATRIAVASTAPVTVGYSVDGVVERIPIFVPGGGAELTVARDVEQPYMIRLSGDPSIIDAIDTETSMPRFHRADDGALEVRLSSLPSFVRLSTGGPTSFARIADIIALLLIATGAVLAYRKVRA